jgi:rhodanese-related sulfurtransferase
MMGTAFTLFACTPHPADAPSADEWRAVKKEIRTRFPHVEQLSVDELSALVSDPERDQPMLVDVRTPEEFAVSRIPGARNVPTGEGFVATFAAVSLEREIVLYCSVGYRSSSAAISLHRAGYRRVRNLEGSIFEWANSGHPLEKPNGSPTRLVHPFDPEWGRLLRADLRAPLAR